MDLPDEPEELALWRGIASYRDDLVARVQNGMNASTVSEGFASQMSEAGRNRASLQASMIEVLAADAQEARTQLDELDAAIRARPEKARMPRKLFESLKEPEWRDAIDKIERLLRADEREEIVNAGLDAVQALHVLTERAPESILAALNDLISRARASRGHRSGRVGEIARTIVADMVGLSRDSRRLR